MPKQKAARMATSATTQHEAVSSDGLPAFHTPHGEPVRLTSRAARELLRAGATRWTYVVRNRRRWASHDVIARRQADRCRSYLKDLGVTDAALAELARAEIVEVDVPFTREETGWEGRVLPWEYVLSAATQAKRLGQGPTIVRHLERPGHEARSAAPPEKVLYVQSAPGKLGEVYSFDSERELVRANLPGLEWKEIADPTREKLEDAIRDFAPDVVHLAGFDIHQARSITGKPKGPGEGDAAAPRPARQRDAYAVAGGKGEPEPLSSLDLMHIVNAGAKPPRFVGLSFWNSGARLAPLIVAAGTQAALGFQDSFDDGLVEVFFASLYRQWSQADWNLSAAFHSAWQALAQRPKGLQGTGIVYWSATSVARELAETARRPRSARRRPTASHAPAATWTEPADVPPARVGDYVAVDIVPVRELNYSLLHNRRPLFEKFTIVNRTRSALGRISVTAELHTGAEASPYRRTCDIDEEVLDLREDVHATLTAPLARSLRETVVSSLFVEVKWGPHVVYGNTHRVRLLPADQWRDTDADRVWLPSFVLPRDPAVCRLVEKAQRYVRVLRDDPGAGFDGYQSYAAERDDPAEEIDLQVQALWSTIVHEACLGYINPPPSYSRDLDSQRLRTPSTVLADRSGTCIDLALLMAACLELVDIYPVLFLLDGHCFPGYWRSAPAHSAFLEVPQESIEDFAPSDEQHAGVSGVLGEPWVLGKSSYGEVLGHVLRGDLVPLETVKLTENSGFWAAVEAGRENLAARDEFCSMLDIVSARYAGVTPLPIWEDRA